MLEFKIVKEKLYQTVQAFVFKGMIDYLVEKE